LIGTVMLYFFLSFLQRISSMFLHGMKILYFIKKAALKGVPLLF